MSRRIYTLVGREGTVVLTDSKKNSNGVGAMYKYSDLNGNTQLIGIKALNKALANIPRPARAKFDFPVVFLLPRFLEFLKYEDTRKVWIETGSKKSGDKIAPEMLEQVKILDKQIEELGVNLQLFGQQGLKSPVFRQYVTATWKVLDNIAPSKIVSANEAY